MKLLLALLSTSVFCTTGIVAQHAGKLMISDDAYLVLYADSGYTAEFTGNRFPFYKQFRYSIKKIDSDKIVEDFFHYSDSCFAYLRYDSNHTVTEKGLVRINPNRKYYDTINIPDVEKDPDLSKGIMKNLVLSYTYFDKTGMWEEVESSLLIRRGEYEIGKKVGLWKVGRYEKNPTYPYHSPFPKEIFKVECTENYKNGTLEEGRRPDFYLPDIWEKLRGAWGMSTFNSIYWVQYFYIRPPFESTVDLSFTFKDTGYMIIGGKEIKWKLENNIIYQYHKDEIRRYRIDYLSADELYLTPLPPELLVTKRKKKK